MASTPLYGGTNGVTELNIGQKGSGLRASGAANFEAQVRHGKPVIPVVTSKPIQTNETIVDNLGFQGQKIIWSGVCRFAALGNYQTVINNIYRAWQGYTRNWSSGAPSAVDRTQMNPTKLVDSHGGVITDKARLVDAQWDRVQVLQGSTWAYFTRLSITFQVLH